MNNMESLQNFYKKSKNAVQKLSPDAMAALAGWWFGGNVQDAYRQITEPTAAQQREFERQIQQAMRKKNKTISKQRLESKHVVRNRSLIDEENRSDKKHQKIKGEPEAQEPDLPKAVKDLQKFYSKQTDKNSNYVRKTPPKNGIQKPEEELLKILSMPPFQGARFDPTSHRWTKPENFAQAYHARKGKKRVRGSGTGVHQRAVSGHGKGRIRGEGAGAHKASTHVAASRKKQAMSRRKR